ncbi:MAG: hypothetical protein II971_02910 [Firmicutes bacterium]|nr:hypothetical protein [Bacillota bacterium]
MNKKTAALILALIIMLSSCGQKAAHADWWIRMFCEGANADNGYTPYGDSYRFWMHEDVNDPQHSIYSGVDIYIENIYVVIPETGEERIVKVFQDPKDKQWYLWGDSYRDLLKDPEQGV